MSSHVINYMWVGTDQTTCDIYTSLLFTGDIQWLSLWYQQALKKSSYKN